MPAKCTSDNYFDDAKEVLETVILDRADLISKIALERPASIRRHLPLASTLGWMLPEYIFGPENESLRYLFADQTIAQLGTLSPLLLYGERNLGKTALSITLAATWSRMSSLRPLCFTTGASFAADFSAAAEIDDLDSFRQRHRACQLLVIDDLNDLARATASQAELVATLDVMAEAGRPVIVTADRLPSTIRGLSSALASRLSGSLSIALKKPRGTTIRELVLAIIPSIDPDLPAAELVEFCQHFSNQSLSMPDIHKIVTIAAQSKGAARSVDFEMVSQLARQLLAGEGPTLASIAKVVARRMQVRLVEMRGATRQANIVRARGLAILLSRRLTSASLQKIGEFFGGRDHSTVIHACRKTEKLLHSDTELANLLQEVQAEVLLAS